MPQPVCRYEGSPLRESSAPELLPRLPLAPAPDSTLPVSSTSTALSALTLGVLNPDAVEHWTPSPSTTTSVNDVAFDEACRVWGITDQAADTCGLRAKTIVNRDAILAARCSAIQNLHAILAQPETCIGDDAVAAVVRLVMSDLCAGETQELGVHMDGIREMTRLRGGLTALGMDGNLTKTALM
ncbi:hypothetical protein NEMBOFW57_007870 [Staphylotrichum longicolle]|uniref:Uncharacterized protein n=1 Tax=Staphylotrichum longicolle TaxID=669026 RepID=A0AAD4EVZ8_9PEZI|nr:hypothetical protein NEMBOFW57_007870 [Staphylotrichum longicolle]